MNSISSTIYDFYNNDIFYLFTRYKESAKKLLVYAKNEYAYSCSFEL